MRENLGEGDIWMRPRNEREPLEKDLGWDFISG
jgi:hypothetical protein